MNHSIFFSRIKVCHDLSYPANSQINGDDNLKMCLIFAKLFEFPDSINQFL